MDLKDVAIILLRLVLETLSYYNAKIMYSYSGTAKISPIFTLYITHSMGMFLFFRDLYKHKGGYMRKITSDTGVNANYFFFSVAWLSLFYNLCHLPKFYAMNFLSDVSIVSIYGSSVLFTYLFSILIMGILVERKGLFSLLMGFLGVFLLLFGDKSIKAHKYMCVLLFASSIFAGLYGVLFKIAMISKNPEDLIKGKSSVINEKKILVDEGKISCNNGDSTVLEKKDISNENTTPGILLSNTDVDVKHLDNNTHCDLDQIKKKTLENMEITNSIDESNFKLDKNNENNYEENFDSDTNCKSSENTSWCSCEFINDEEKIAVNIKNKNDDKNKIPTKNNKYIEDQNVCISNPDDTQVQENIKKRNIEDLPKLIKEDCQIHSLCEKQDKILHKRNPNREHEEVDFYSIENENVIDSIDTSMDKITNKDKKITYDDNLDDKKYYIFNRKVSAETYRRILFMRHYISLTRVVTFLLYWPGLVFINNSNLEKITLPQTFRPLVHIFIANVISIVHNVVYFLIVSSRSPLFAQISGIILQPTFLFIQIYRNRGISCVAELIGCALSFVAFIVLSNRH